MSNDDSPWELHVLPEVLSWINDLEVAAVVKEAIPLAEQRYASYLKERRSEGSD